MRTDQERLMQKVAIAEGGCWLWRGCVDSTGYGKFRFNGKVRGAHRVAYLICRGTIPDGLCVIRRCDSLECVNPSHHMIGSQAGQTRIKR